jgi:hypothetical protein
MAEWVNAPRHARAGGGAKGGIHQARAKAHLVHGVEVGNCGLVVHGPPAIDHLQAVLRHQQLHVCAHSVGLRVQPAHEEAHLDSDKTPVGVAQQRSGHRIIHPAYTTLLN